MRNLTATSAVAAMVILVPMAATATNIQGGADGTFVNGVLIPDCPPPPIPRGPLADSRATDLPYNHRAFAGETDGQMFERHKREAIAELNAPCHREFEKRFNAAIAAGKRTDEAKVKARGSEYFRQFGELYIYGKGDFPQGYLLLRQGNGRVILANALEIPAGRYTVAGGYFNCDLAGGDCHSLTPRMDEFDSGIPSRDGELAAVVRDARAGRLRVFSNAEKLLIPTPW